MIIAYAFGVVSLSIIIIAGFLWLVLAREWIIPTWRHVSTKVTSGDLSLDLCYRCAEEVKVNKCFKIYGDIYCPICTAIIGTAAADDATKITIMVSKVAVVFFTCILILSAITVIGIM